MYFGQYLILKLLLCVYKCKSCCIRELLFAFGILRSGVHVFAQVLLHPTELWEEKAAGMSALSWHPGRLVLPRCCQPKHAGNCSCSLPPVICPDGKYFWAVAGFQTVQELVASAQCLSEY